MPDGRIEESQASRPVVPPGDSLSLESLDPMDDTAGKPFFGENPRNIHGGQSGETTFIQNKAKADAVRVGLREGVTLQDNRLRSPSSETPQILTLERDWLNIQLRDLRISLKNADTFFAKWTQAGRDTLTSLQREIDETRAERDLLDAKMEAMLPAQAKSVPRADVIAAVGQKIGDIRASVIAEQRELRSSIPRKDVLRADRIKLSGELVELRFWQFGRKQEIATKIREIDQEMSGIIRAERKE